uniref:VWFA domain-containing protein n=1 Tax=Tetraodon nigroviridis TaxID=99883 RepID=H3DCM0_TETNG
MSQVLHSVSFLHVGTTTFRTKRSLDECFFNIYLQACGPTIPKDCPSLTMYNGVCLQLGSNNPDYNTYAFTFTDCPSQADVAFLLDGSGSVNPSDFDRMKTFVSTLMDQIGSPFGNVIATRCSKPAFCVLCCCRPVAGWCLPFGFFLHICFV